MFFLKETPDDSKSPVNIDIEVDEDV